MLPWELQSVVLGRVLGATPLAQVPAAAAALGATCRQWRALLRADNALLWHTALAAHAPALPAVVAGAAVATEPLRARIAAAWRLSCAPATACRALVLQPRAANLRDTVRPMPVAYPGAPPLKPSGGGNGHGHGNGNSAANAGMAQVAQPPTAQPAATATTTRWTEITPDPRTVHCVAVVGDAKALLYRAMGAARDALPLVRAGMYPGGALALRCGRREQLFLSARLPLAARSTQALIVVVAPRTGTTADAVAAAAAPHVAAAAAHARVLPVAVLVPAARIAPLAPRPADIAARLAPLLDAVDHACVALFDPQTLDGLPQVLEWIYNHLPRASSRSSYSPFTSFLPSFSFSPRLRW